MVAASHENVVYVYVIVIPVLELGDRQCLLPTYATWSLFTSPTPWILCCSFLTQALSRQQLSLEQWASELYHHHCSLSLNSCRGTVASCIALFVCEKTNGIISFNGSKQSNAFWKESIFSFSILLCQLRANCSFPHSSSQWLFVFIITVTCKKIKKQKNKTGSHEITCFVNTF